MSFAGAAKSHADDVLEPVQQLVETNLLRNIKRRGKLKAESSRREEPLLMFAIRGGTEDLVYSNQ